MGVLMDVTGSLILCLFVSLITKVCVKVKLKTKKKKRKTPKQNENRGEILTNCVVHKPHTNIVQEMERIWNQVLKPTNPPSF